MLYKKLAILYSVLFILLILLTSILFYIPPNAIAQQDNTNFLTYANTDYGFTLKYPSNWTVNDTDINGSGFRIYSPDRVAVILVNIKPAVANETLGEIAKAYVSGRTTMPLEINTNTYFLSGHHAVRAIDSGTFTSGREFKLMSWAVIVGNKSYAVGYYATPAARFPDYIQTAQNIVDSFQIISKQ